LLKLADSILSPNPASICKQLRRWRVTSAIASLATFESWRLQGMSTYTDRARPGRMAEDVGPQAPRRETREAEQFVRYVRGGRPALRSEEPSCGRRSLMRSRER